MPGWQAKFEQYGGKGFTVVGIAMDAEGAAPAKIYYERAGVRFPALVDPNYALGFGAIPHTFFVDEHGVVQPTEGWEERLKPAGQLRPVDDALRAQWSEAAARLGPAATARLASRHEADPADLPTATELASRYLQLQLPEEARKVLLKTIPRHDPKATARSGDEAKARLLSQAYFQLARAFERERTAQVRHATLSFYLQPTVGFGKQISRLIAPEKFDHRPAGDFDNEFREGTLKRLREEREAWLQAD